MSLRLFTDTFIHPDLYIFVHVHTWGLRYSTHLSEVSTIVLLDNGDVSGERRLEQAVDLVQPTTSGCNYIKEGIILYERGKLQTMQANMYWKYHSAVASFQGLHALFILE